MTSHEDAHHDRLTGRLADPAGHGRRVDRRVHGGAPARAGPWRLAGRRVESGFEEVAEQLGEYFAGERTRFTLRTRQDGTDFQRRVWQAVAAIPFGQTCSYARLAEAVGRPDRLRAVAAAVGRNPLAIVVPCHRVIGADGSLTGYAGGLARKRFLLDLEQSAARGQAPLPVRGAA